jgi:hypothetical protein
MEVRMKATLCRIFDIHAFLQHLIDAIVHSTINDGLVIAVLLFGALAIWSAFKSGKVWLVAIATLIGVLWFVVKQYDSICGPNVRNAVIDAYQKPAQTNYVICLQQASAPAKGLVAACYKTFKLGSQDWINCVKPYASEYSPYEFANCESKYGPQSIHPQ